jgi:ketosteroid isomerase-like protein
MMSFKAILAASLLLAPAALQAQAGALTLEQRVERMEAESAIRRVLIEYGAFLDGRDYAAYAGLFAPDGVWVGGFGTYTGPAAIEKMLSDNLGPPEPGFVNKSSFHMMTNPVIEIDGDRARVNSRYLFWTRAGDRPSPALAGRYVDEFVRRDGQWKIARRTTHGVIPFRDPEHPETNDPAPDPATAAAAPTLEARLKLAEDTLAIQRVIIEYAARLDAHDYSGYAALFARGGQWINGSTVRTGPEEIRQMLVGLYGEAQPGYVNMESYHLTSNPQVEVNGDRATARSRHLLIMRGEGGAPNPALTGLYEDEYIREDGQWKILKRVDNPIMPTREEWMRQMQARRAAE